MAAQQPTHPDATRRDTRRPAVHRDGDGQQIVARDWESLTDRLIREAQERGEFDDLPGRGQPLRLQSDAYAGEMALAYQMLRNAGAAPPWIEADKEARGLQAERDGLLARAGRATVVTRGQLRRDFERVVTAHAAAVARLNATAPTPRQHRRPMRLSDELAELERRLDARGRDPRASAEA